MSIIAKSTKMKVLWVRCECPNKTERTETTETKIMCANVCSAHENQASSVEYISQCDIATALP